jgi:hypothetical protein
MFFQHGNYQIRLRIMVGPRCGLFEACTIVDIRPKETEIDHLVASSCQRLEVIDSKTFLDLPPKVLEVKKSRNKHLLMATIAEWLERELLCFKEDPERCQAMIEGYHHIQEEMQTGSSIVCTGNALTRT